VASMKDAEVRREALENSRKQEEEAKLKSCSESLAILRKEHQSLVELHSSASKSLKETKVYSSFMLLLLPLSFSLLPFILSPVENLLIFFHFCPSRKTMKN
jgi:hypothetical protein